ncbi:MAG: hypothetical protein KGI99_06080 [Bradyrhizobium sp.]|uniref:hypothetical protein n=1 Tax=Bradyrhizobium sp. TaxID=376 RepID=UPI001C285AE7|nr:hypothetical protein [Bradyrhizobium sp.]MBU6463336.1 hypothetical protein [Pseudomonadota bacterium]MDE2066786.1 hypothetical protein [Bradyrhizobium sp.]
MSSGRYCVIRDLGLVKGGKGMRRHEELLVLTPKGVGIFLIAIAKRLLAQLTANSGAHPSEDGKAQQSAIRATPGLAKSVVGRKLLAGATVMLTALTSLVALVSSQRLSIQRRIQHVRAVQHQEQRK